MSEIGPRTISGHWIIRIETPGEPPKGTWHPFLVLDLPGLSKQFRIWGKPRFESQDIKIPLKALLLKSNANSLPRLSMNIRLGARLQETGEEVFGKKIHPLVMISLESLKRRPITVRVKGLRRSPLPKRGWFQSQNRLSGASVDGAIHLRDARQLRSIAGYLVGSNAFRLSSDVKPSPRSAIHFVGQRGPLGFLTTSPKRSVIRDLARSLNAIVAYEGSVNDFKMLPEALLGRFNMVETDLLKFDRVNLVSKKNVMMISEDMLESDLGLLKVAVSGAKGTLKSDTRVVFP